MTLQESITQAGARLINRVQLLGRISDSREWLERSLFSPAAEEAAHRIREWMTAAGLDVVEDPLSNLVGSYIAHEAGASGATIHMGSHYDTVVNGGAYDGGLGVLLGIATAEAIIHSKTPLKHNLSAMAFCDEEGVRFHTTFLGSAFLSGQFEREWLHVCDGMGKTLGEWMVDRGDSPDQLFEAKPVIRPQDFFLEAHIEQGPILEYQNKAMGVFTSIAAQLRAEVTVRGLAGHAGTIPSYLRKDPLPGVGEMILAVENLCKRDESRRVTVGKVDVHPNASNVIPGQVRFTIDLRQPNYAGLHATYGRLESELAAIAQRRGLEYEAKVLQATKNVDCDPDITTVLSDSCLKVQKHAPQLLSGAGHDSMKIAQVCPVGMLAIRCRDGLSHHPDEFASEADCLLALQVMVDSVLKMDKTL